jgi:hypothetical protein
MAGTCPICLGSSVHKREAYPQEFDLPSLSNHQSMDGKPSCGLDTTPGNHSVLLEASDELGISIRNDGP